jgi:hypothetical protein
MKRFPYSLMMIGAGVLATAVVHADVKTREKTTVKFEGMLGTMANMFGGSAMKDGITSTVAVKGSRMLRMSDAAGRIVDLDEQKVYTLDPKKKEYKVLTFAEIRAEAEKMRADADKKAQSMTADQKQQTQDASQQMEVDVDVKETGQHKTILGKETKEVIVTVITRHTGQKLEEGGGFVMTTDEWLGPKMPELDEIVQFELKYIKAVSGQALVLDPQQAAQINAMFPQFKTMGEKMQAEGSKLQGTALETTLTFESVKSAAEMKQAQQQSQQQQQGGGGGGIGGMLGAKFGPKPGPVDQRTKVMTTTHTVLAVDTAVTPADLAIPAGFKEKK